MQIALSRYPSETFNYSPVPTLVLDFIAVCENLLNGLTATDRDLFEMRLGIGERDRTDHSLWNAAEADALLLRIIAQKEPGKQKPN